jgi:predicted transcriptional regulator/ribosomal protein S18 acetylase RimI-like enzyme
MQNQMLIKDISISRAVSSDYPSILEFLVESTHLYPAIDNWWTEKVVPGVLEGRRVIYVLKKEDTIKGLFIGKKGRSNSKICTLRLENDVKENGFGKALLLEGLRHIIDKSTKNITVTVSEAAESSVARFFESLGFRNIANVRNRYSHGVDEHIYICPVPHHLSSLLLEPTCAKNDASIGQDAAILFSLKPQFADLVINGKKQVEFRRRFSSTMQGSLAYFYVSSPVKRIMFSSILSKVHHCDVNYLWKQFCSIGGVSKKDYFSYFTGTNNGYAIELDNVKALSKMLSLDYIRNTYMPSFRPPQSHYILRQNSPLFRLLET